MRAIILLILVLPISVFADQYDKILEAIASHHGTPVGVKTIAVIVGEEEDTIEDVYEPFLIQEGYILKTARGRLLAGKGYEHMGLKAPRGGAADAAGLF